MTSERVSGECPGVSRRGPVCLQRVSSTCISAIVDRSKAMVPNVDCASDGECSARAAGGANATKATMTKDEAVQIIHEWLAQRGNSTAV